MVKMMSSRSSLLSRLASLNTLIILVAVLAVVSTFATFVNIQHQNQCNIQFREALATRSAESGTWQTASRDLINGILDLEQPVTPSEVAEYQERIADEQRRFNLAYENLERARAENPLPESC